MPDLFGRKQPARRFLNGASMDFFGAPVVFGNGFALVQIAGITLARI